MTGNFKNEYLHNKNYVAIYLHNFFDVLGKSTISIFSAVLLYKIGFAIDSILLFFAFQFGLMGLLSPLSPFLVSKIGLVKTILISNIFRVIGTIFLLKSGLTASYSLFLIFIFFSIDGAIYHPLQDGINSIYVKNEHKGKVNSFTTVLKTIATMVAVLIAGQLALAHDYILLGIIVAAMVFSVIPYMLLMDKKEIPVGGNFFDAYKLLFSKKFKENIIPFSAKTFLIVERIFIPLYVFILVGNFKIVSYVIAFSVIFEMAATFIFCSNKF